MKHSLQPLALLFALSLSSCASPPPETDPTYRAEIEIAWAAREVALTADDGWLTLTGLYWLHPGPNTVGASTDAAVQLPSGAAPPEVGILDLGEDGLVTLRPSPTADLTVNGEAAVEAELDTDKTGNPDLLRAGRILFYLIERGDRIGVRVKDPEAPARSGFKGLDHFPVNPDFRINATLEPYPEPREVAIPTVIGEPSVMFAPGLLRFEIDGEAVTLEPYVSSPGDRGLFLVFRDATSGDTTYGAGRFLDAEIVEGSHNVILDFNLATSPPCAFTPFATCPLPTPENTLFVPISAGEKYAGPAH